MAPKNVVVYSAPTCVACTNTKEFLLSKGIKYTVRDITSDKRVMDGLLRVTGGKQVVPVTIIDNMQVIIGFDQAGLSKALGVKY